MLVYLDANVVIYLVEQPPVWGQRAQQYVSAVCAAGDDVAIGDLHRLECLTMPLRIGDAARVADFERMFTSTFVKSFSMTRSVCYRAAALRAAHRLESPDALHLATAIEHGCGRFVTNDVRLAAVTQIPVEII